MAAAAAAAAAAGSCKTATFFPISVPKPPQLSKHIVVFSYSTCRCSSPSLAAIPSPSARPRPLSPPSVSSPETTVVVAEEDIENPPSESDEMALEGSLPPLTGCKACGKEEIERGCNGEGRIQGGIATVPGFGWWPIKAYRPCPAYVASGGRYRRIGQSMDDVVSGRGKQEK